MLREGSCQESGVNLNSVLGRSLRRVPAASVSLPTSTALRHDHASGGRQERLPRETKFQLLLWVRLILPSCACLQLLSQIPLNFRLPANGIVVKDYPEAPDIKPQF